MKKAAENHLGTSVSEAVITVPAYFDDAQRNATINSAKIAGLKVKRIINEPTAAALAYKSKSNEPTKIAVYDLGGGTFDISILSLAKDEEDTTTQVLSTHGNTSLGGIDFDERLVSLIAKKFKEDKKNRFIIYKR
jgi:molecular chaperone DnaK